MNILFIDITYHQPLNENSINEIGLGGSETWLMQLSDAFTRKGHCVTICSECGSHLANNGIRFVAKSEMELLLKYNKFDLIIVTRCCNNILELIDQYHTCDNVYIQAHDIVIFFDINPHYFKCFKGVATLSAYQERLIHDHNYIEWDYMYRIGNGIDPTLFELDNTPKTRRLLWSSEYGQRGGSLLSQYILPRLSNSGVDYTVPIYNINDIVGLESNNDVSFLGSLNKHDLYHEMSQRYCWFYPLVWHETFCITMLENIMCENDIITPLTYGTHSVLEPYIDDIAMKYRFDRGEDEFRLAVDEAVERINDSFENREKGEELRRELKNYVLQNYTWDRIADKWLKLI
jgi:hypothetical protein